MFGEYLYLWAPLLTAAAFIAIVPIFDARNNRGRTFVALLCATIGIRYVVWRLTATVLPASGSLVQVGWIWICFVIELAALGEVLIFLLILSRTINRSGEADRAEARLLDRPRDAWPTVDLFIPTYNEGIEILEKTIIGALAIDYPRFKIWVLDDGQRPWLATFCAEHGVGYLTRPDNAHAKAGNINHALSRTSGELVAILDADFIPYRAFLRRTVGLFDDPTVGIVQTPQHFYNRDPIQSNLTLHRVWPDEQRLFFDVMAPCRDAWNVAFCCGSCSVMRRQAVDAIGGAVPTASVTEDLLTTLAMLRHGYVTRYLNERLSHGLAPESIEAFFVQRARWARGAIQSLFLEEGLRGPGLTWFQRILFFPVSWLIQYPVRIMALLIPVVYLWTGLTPLLFTRIQDLLAYQLPMLLALALGMRWLAPHHYLPFLSNAAGNFATFRLLPTILSSLIRPFGAPFKVTPKGSNVRWSGIDRRSLTFAVVLIACSIAGLVLNTMPQFQRMDTLSFFPVAATWTFLNLLSLLIVVLICFESPRRRKEERFPVDEPSLLVIDDFVGPCRMVDLSLSGARVRLEGNLPPGAVQPGANLQVAIAEVGLLPALVVQQHEKELRMMFGTLPPAFRHRLIAKLFGGDHDNAVRRLDVRTLLGALLQRCFGPVPTSAAPAAPVPEEPHPTTLAGAMVAPRSDPQPANMPSRAPVKAASGHRA